MSAAPVRRRGRPRALTHERIAGAALRLADRDGPDALTMQRLAAELGTGTMTLYGYFPRKDDLLDAVIDHAVRGAGAPPADSGTADAWRADLRALVRYAYRNLVRHPSIVEIRLRRPILRPEALRFGERAMQILLRAGLEPAVAASSFRALYTYLFGYAAVSPQRATSANRRAASAALARLPADQYPTLIAHRTVFSNAMAGSQHFEHGLDLILDGIAARVAR
jgi:AcrR family transcriptional regulator